MEQVSAQTEKIATYETSRTRRSIVDGNMHSDDSNNDEEYASSGFYVREKSSDKKPESSSSNSKGNDGDLKGNDKLLGQSAESLHKRHHACSYHFEDNDFTDPRLKRRLKKGVVPKSYMIVLPGPSTSSNGPLSFAENGVSEESSTVSPVLNGETSRDDEISKDSKAAVEENNEDSKAKIEIKHEEIREDPKDAIEEKHEENSEESKAEVEEKHEENSEDSKTAVEEKHEENSEDSKTAVEEKHEENNEDSKTPVEEKHKEKSDDPKTPVEEEHEENNEDSKTPVEEKHEEKSDDPKTPVEEKHEENSEDSKAATEEQQERAESSKDLKAAVEEKHEENEAEVEVKANTLPETNPEIPETPGTVDSLATPGKGEDNNVSSSSNNEPEENICSTSNNEAENDVSSTSNNTEQPKTVEAEDQSNVDETKEDKGEKTENAEPKADTRVDVEASMQKFIITKPEDQIQSGDKDDDKNAVSILKEHLERPSNGSENNEHDVDMDEDFDPSLLCPDISMDVDEASVVTNAEHAPDDGSTSPLPYEPIFSTLVDEITGAEVQIDLTPAEMELRQKMYGPNNPVQATKVHCTACNVHLGSALTGANNRFVHPLLKVLICKNCYHFYTSGEFEKDEDGSELYCRWCGQGGQVLCCSSCEFVFCKRCIRNNFGPRKFKEIRDSDDWNCFRCEPEQLSNLRASCAEFMEYYRTELARAHSMAETNPELMSADYTKCCCAPPEKKEEPKTPVAPKARRKRKDEEDPDYRPVLDEEEPPAKKPVPTTGPGCTVTPTTATRPLVTKAGVTPATATVRQVGTMQPVRPQSASSQQIFKVGNTTFRTKTPGTSGYTIQRPALNQGANNNSPGYYIKAPTSTAPKTTTPGYIRILPQRAPAPTRPTNPYTVISGTNNAKPSFNTVRTVKPSQMPPMKHEWFEKTVRAAARVNSNLSYTLTQLNRQQSQASSVEALAMVHNKLQEVLSTSINSLIQIRKNLRSEFIAGIKNIKFPPKPAPIPPTTGPIIVKDDDDVIFVSPTTTASQTQPPPLVLSQPATLPKKTPVQKSSDLFTNPQPSTSGVKPPNNVSKQVKPAVTTTTPSTGPLKGGFLKVRSFTSLQTVPSECIMIPDDPPVPRVVMEDPLKLIEEGDPFKANENAIEWKEDPQIIVNVDPPKVQQQRSIENEMPSSTFDEWMVYDVKKKPTPQIQKMMNAFVALKKSRDVDDMLRSQGLIKGASDSSGKGENGVA